MKHALVTGASEGIGRSFAMQLAAEGYTITAVARNLERLKELTNELGSGSHSYVVADLSSNSGVAQIKETLEQKKFSLLVNNAGLAFYGAFRQMDINKLNHMMRVNCDCVLQLSHAFLRAAQSGDALINVSSIASTLPMPITSLYAASKAFVTSLSQNLWYEERKRGVYVMALCPGVTKTSFNRRAGGDDKDIPLLLMTQTPDQVVRVALRALKKRSQPIVSSGAQKYFVWLSRIISRKWVTLMSGYVVDRGLPKKDGGYQNK